MEAKYSIVLAFVMIGLVTAQNSDNFEDGKKIRHDHDKLPSTTVPLDYDPLIKQKQSAWKTKCEENGGHEVFSHAQDAVDKFSACVQQYVNVSELEKQIEAATPKGQVDEVFKKYCLLRPQFKTCFRNMSEDVKGCLNVKEKENLKILFNVTDKLTEFACYNDGERLALIVAEDGIQCFSSKKEQLLKCFEKDENYINYLEFGKEHCMEMLKIQPCIVSVLETCEKSTIANVVDSMMSSIFKYTPCKEYSETLSLADGAVGITVFTATAIITFLVAILV